ncbi:MAG: hypothetical protein RIA63_08990 [Cyclobacteriaceae bacterium]
MRISLLIIVSLLGTLAYGQGARAKGPRSLNFEKVEGTLVPEVIKENFESSFQGAVAVRWEKHTLQGNKTGIRYVAIFTEGGVRSRARYKEDGTVLSSTKYYGAIKLPENIKAAAKAKYPEFTVMGGEEITTRNGKTFYRVRSRKGPSKLVQYFDGDGNEITKEKAPEDLLEGEDDEGN